MSKLAYLFPGQGSQKVGMGQDLYESSPVARQVFDDADRVLGYRLSEIMFAGPEDELKKTANTQPAILTHSIAVLRCLEALGFAKPDYVAGHSLGEYSALVACGTLTFEDAVKAVHFRGKAMQDAVPLGTGAMAAVIGLEPDQIEDACSKTSQNPDNYVAVANFNGPGQTVIAGTANGVEQAALLLKEIGARRVLPLPVSAPFHCNLMEPAKNRLAVYLSDVKFEPAKIPLVSNVKAQFVQDPTTIRELLVAQVVEPVRFTDMVTCLHEAQVKRFVEIGPGKVLLGIVKRMVEGAELMNVEDTASLQAATQGDA
jgi:[acyl-carrier-protein] S-malonyltransferase